MFVKVRFLERRCTGKQKNFSKNIMFEFCHAYYKRQQRARVQQNITLA